MKRGLRDESKKFGTAASGLVLGGRPGSRNPIGKFVAERDGENYGQGLS